MKSLMVYTANGGKNWYIRIRNKKNGKILADGGESYVSRSNALRAAHNNWVDGFDLREVGKSDIATLYDMVPRAST